MTKKEEEIINELLRTVRELRAENAKYREDVTSQINAINLKVNKVHEPIAFESDILKVTQHAINESISKVLTGIEDLHPKYAVMFCPNIEKVQTWTLLHMCNTIEEAKQEILWRLSYMKTNDGDLVIDNDGRFSTWRDETKNTNEYGLVHEPTDQDINLNYNAGSMLQVIAESNNQQQNGFRGMAYYGGIEIGNYREITKMYANV